jgi:hypothetical protein
MAEISYDEFLALVNSAQGDGKCSFRVGISLYRDSDSTEEGEEQVAPDAMVLARVVNLPDHVIEMIWNSFFTAIQSMNMDVYAMTASEKEKDRIRKGQEEMEKAQAEGKEITNPNLH